MFQILQRRKGLEQILFWIFIYLFLFDYHFWEYNWSEALKDSGLEILTYVLVFYFNLKIAIPRFLAQKREKAYLLLISFSFVFYVFFIKISGLEQHFYESSFWRNVFSMLVNLGLFWLLSTMFWYYQSFQTERELQLQAKSDQLETEIKLLKSQIQPHFIFNTLNNVYSLVQQGNPNAAPMLAKLSNILRYILYNNEKRTTILEKEINVIQEYINLQLLRNPLSENIDFYVEGYLKNHQIVPLLLLSWVENCFKHGDLDKNEAGFIKVSCILENDTLYFSTENSQQPSIQTRELGGIGNKNIERQLLLNYPNRHKLEIEETVDTFKLEVQITLK